MLVFIMFLQIFWPASWIAVSASFGQSRPSHRTHTCTVENVNTIDIIGTISMYEYFQYRQFNGTISLIYTMCIISIISIILTMVIKVMTTLAITRREFYDHYHCLYHYSRRVVHTAYTNMDIRHKTAGTGAAERILQRQRAAPRHQS